jgi:hypothetical protein
LVRIKNTPQHSSQTNKHNRHLNCTLKDKFIRNQEQIKKQTTMEKFKFFDVAEKKKYNKQNKK